MLKLIKSISKYKKFMYVFFETYESFETSVEKHFSEKSNETTMSEPVFLTETKQNEDV